MVEDRKRCLISLLYMVKTSDAPKTTDRSPPVRPSETTYLLNRVRKKRVTSDVPPDRVIEFR